MSLAREQMMARIKADTEEASQRREQALRKEKTDAVSSCTWSTN